MKEENCNIIDRYFNSKKYMAIKDMKEEDICQIWKIRIDDFTMEGSPE